MGAVLLVLRHRLDAVAYLQFHGARKEQLALLVALARMLNQRVRVGLLNCGAIPVGRVKIVDIQRVASRRRRLVTVVNCARAVALISFQSTSVVANRSLRIENGAFSRKCVAVGVEAKVGLIHKLLVETRINGNILTSRAWWCARFLPLEELGQNQLLLIVHAVNVHAFSLNCRAKFRRL